MLVHISLTLLTLSVLSTQAEDTLELVHVIFRDGDRTPSGLWTSNPYHNESFYYPYGYGQLTNTGKHRSYEMGMALRDRYNDFLGDVWNMKMYDAWSTDYNRTKMTMNLVLAGLFPPDISTEWNSGLLWQPIPYNYRPVSLDKELSSWACSTVVPLIYGNDENVAKLKTYDSLMEVLSNGTGESIDYLSALDIYVNLVLQEKLGFELEDWTAEVYPEPLKSYYVDFYYIETSTVELKRILGGFLVRKILSDTQRKINGTLTPQERKIFLYSSHESSIAFTLLSLQAYNLTELPPAESFILVEVHKIDDVHGIKIFYDDYTTSDPIPISIPGCAKFCPIDDFVELTMDIIPDSDEECFGAEIMFKTL